MSDYNVIELHPVPIYIFSDALKIRRILNLFMEFFASLSETGMG